MDGYFKIILFITLFVWSCKPNDVAIDNSYYGSIFTSVYGDTLLVRCEGHLPQVIPLPSGIDVKNISDSYNASIPNKYQNSMLSDSFYRYKTTTTNVIAVGAMDVSFSSKYRYKMEAKVHGLQVLNNGVKVKGKADQLKVLLPQGDISMDISPFSVIYFEDWWSYYKHEYHIRNGMIEQMLVTN